MVPYIWYRIYGTIYGTVCMVPNIWYHIYGTLYILRRFKLSDSTQLREGHLELGPSPRFHVHSIPRFSSTACRCSRRR